jgi:hypothetical protein
MAMLLCVRSVIGLRANLVPVSKLRSFCKVYLSQAEILPMISPIAARASTDFHQEVRG